MTIVRSGAAELYVSAEGDPAAPTVLFVHGFPDTHSVWDELRALLADRFHVVAYDTRGSGRSTNPDGPDGMLLATLTQDLEAVVDAVSPGAPVHLVGHDWGAFQCWDALTDDRLTGRIASFTPIAGPRIDQAAGWLLRRLRPWSLGLGDVGGQLRRSWYIAALQLPVLPELVAGRASARDFARVLKLTEGLEARPGHPADTFAADARNGLALYRRNLRGQLGVPRAVRGNVPVQLIVPTRDAYIAPALYDDAGRWAPRIWRRDIRAGHWVVRSHPEPLARAIAEFADHVEGGPGAPALARARRNGAAGPLCGRLAVVTGGGAGIGRETALALARDGADVVLCDIDAAAARATAKAIGEQATALKVDVGDRKALERFARRVERDHGVPSIVVNNAGIGMGGPFLDTTADDWRRIIDINLMGVIHGSRLFAAQMVAAGVEGQILNVASAAAFAPVNGMSAYATTKAAVLMLSETMRGELAHHGIGVTAVCPGFIATDITRTLHVVGAGNGDAERLRNAATRAYALRGYGPDKVARAIVGAVHSNPAVLPVAPEAHAIRALSRVAPEVLRVAGRIDPAARVRGR